MISLFSSPAPRRVAGISLAAALGLGALVAGATPATADPLPTFSVSGSATVDVDGETKVSDELTIRLINSANSVVDEENASVFGGSFTFSDVAPGTYTALFELDGQYLAAESEESAPFAVSDGDVTLPAVSLTALPALAAQVTVTGSAVVGETLTATVSPVTDTAGVPVAGATTSFNWGYGRGQSGDEITGATGLTLVVPEEAVGGTIGYSGYLRADGFRPTLVGSNGLLVSAPVKTARPAPVADSSELGAYLDSLYVERAGADTAGLPAKVEQGKAQVANIEWWGGDSYVDVYAYSAPVFIGTFAVVDGKVSLTLTPEVLAQLGEGAHTLVYVGQSSGSVQAVAFEVGGPVAAGARLAETGTDPLLPIGFAGALLVLGAGVLVARRRSALASR